MQIEASTKDNVANLLKCKTSESYRTPVYHYPADFLGCGGCGGLQYQPVFAGLHGKTLGSEINI